MTLESVGGRGREQGSVGRGDSNGAMLGLNAFDAPFFSLFVEF
jgi:hypothetical protein